MSVVAKIDAPVRSVNFMTRDRITLATALRMGAMLTPERSPERVAISPPNTGLVSPPTRSQRSECQQALELWLKCRNCFIKFLGKCRTSLYSKAIPAVSASVFSEISGRAPSATCTMRPDSTLEKASAAHGRVAVRGCVSNNDLSRTRTAVYRPYTSLTRV